jgi:type I restriction enzyme S subunit
VSNVDKKSVDGELRVRLCNYTDVYYNDRIAECFDFMSATASAAQAAAFQLRVGDTLITKDSETADDIGVAAYVDEALPGVLCGYHLAMIRPLPEIDSRFLNWAVRSDFVREQWAVAASGVTRFGLTYGAIKDAQVPLPPLDVQRRIADFLDDQVGRIEKVQVLRHRQRQALGGWVASSGAEIVDALLPVEWTRLSRFWRCIEQGGSPLGTGTEVLGSEPGVVKTSCVKQGVFFPNENKALADPAKYEARYRLVPGDLLIVRGSGSGDLVADCAVVTEDVSQMRLMLSDLIYRPAGLQLNPRFVCAFLLTPRGKSQIRVLVRQGSGPAKVRGEDIGSVQIPVLSGTDQSRFAAAYWGMREHASKIDQSLKQSVDLLEERRRSLITAAVTGEFDVTTASSRAAGVALSGAGGVVS